MTTTHRATDLGLLLVMGVVMALSVRDGRSYAYYLGQRYATLEPGVEEKGWIAVPARLLRWGQARPAPRQGWSSDSFAWLARYQPVTVIGNSIFVYEIR